MDRHTKSSFWFWVLVIALCAVAVQALVAATTYDSACVNADTPRTWKVFPPGWECGVR